MEILENAVIRPDGKYLLVNQDEKGSRQNKTKNSGLGNSSTRLRGRWGGGGKVPKFNCFIFILTPFQRSITQTTWKDGIVLSQPNPTQLIFNFFVVIGGMIP